MTPKAANIGPLARRIDQVGEVIYPRRAGDVRRIVIGIADARFDHADARVVEVRLGEAAAA